MRGCVCEREKDTMMHKVRDQDLQTKSPRNATRETDIKSHTTSVNENHTEKKEREKGKRLRHTKGR